MTARTDAPSVQFPKSGRAPHRYRLTAGDLGGLLEPYNVLEVHGGPITIRTAQNAHTAAATTTAAAR
jgi:hypothetical protein